MRTMRTRPGITLIEVLIAIFIMAIGMLALLVLFPIGALNMARAIKDDRAASSVTNATSTAIAWDLRHDREVVNAIGNTPNGFAPTQPEAPSYPVFVDPSYWALGLRTLGTDGNRIGILRSPVHFQGLGWDPVALAPSAPAQLAVANRWFTFQDDIPFGDNGLPESAVYERGGKYTWAYLLRRPINTDSSVVEMDVLVYYDRSAQVPEGETTYQAGGGKDDTSIAIGYNPTQGEAKPPIRQGTWLLDTTYEVKTVQDGSGRQFGYVHAHFYKVLNVKELGPNVVGVEVDRRLVEGLNRITVMEDVVEVFEKGTGWHP